MVMAPAAFRCLSNGTGNEAHEGEEGVLVHVVQHLQLVNDEVHHCAHCRHGSVAVTLPVDLFLRCNELRHL